MLGISQHCSILLWLNAQKNATNFVTQMIIVFIYALFFLLYAFFQIYAMSKNFQVILEDLSQGPLQNILVIPPPYRNDNSFSEKFEITYKAVKRASRLNRRMLLLINAFYLGKLLESDIDSQTKRCTYSAKLSKYYLATAVRLYYLYEYLGLEHLMRSTKMTLTDIRQLSSEEYEALLVETTKIFNRS